jgi:beta-phosphoglucomutase-like phosphatase (HAD superfamily)
MKWQAVFFDFDGVILDSVNVKTEAFAKMYESYGKKIEEAVVAYHCANAGVSRYKKFSYFEEKLLGHPPLTETQMEKLSQQFSDLVLTGVLQSPFIEGAMSSLEYLKKNSIPAFVASGTPDEEMKFIVKERKLSNYFAEVHGSPRLKDEIVTDILARFTLQAKECLFIGDAMSDYEAAQKTQLQFLGIVQPPHNSPFPHGTWIENSVQLNKS